MAHRICFICVALLAGSACTDTESATNLITHGPPAIQQVRLSEDYLDATGSPATRRVFAFGSLPDATPDDEHAVTSATITQDAPGMRIIMGSLLVGNYLEQIQCRGVVGPDGAFGDVPIGATPDDIAKCSVTNDVLPETCKGDHAVCMCQLAAGCTVGGTVVPQGAPVGVLDQDEDGAADVHQFKPGAAAVTCTGDGGKEIVPPIDLAQSYWYPSGDQQVPATGGFEALGPAIVLHLGNIVANSGPVFPTNATCGLTFSVDVVGKDNLRICAPPEGRPASCTGNLDECVETCTPGDVSAFSFKTSVMQMSIQGLSDGDTGVARTADLVAQSNTALDADAIANLQITENGAPYTMYTVALNNPPKTFTIHWTNPTGLDPNAMYTIVFPTTITDAYGQALPAPVTISFTTGAT